MVIVLVQNSKFVTLLLKAVKRGSVLKVDFCYDF